MASEDVQTNIRLPGALKDRLVEAADANNRSLSAEISQRLSQSFDTPAGPPVRYVAFLQEELHRLNGEDRKARRILRAAMDMLGLFQGYTRQLGAKLTQGEQDDLNDLLRLMTAAIEAPGVRDSMVSEVEKIVAELERLDSELEAAGLSVTSEERAELAEQKAKLTSIKARKPNV